MQTTHTNLIGKSHCRHAQWRMQEILPHAAIKTKKIFYCLCLRSVHDVCGDKRCTGWLERYTTDFDSAELSSNSIGDGSGLGHDGESDGSRRLV